MESTLNPNDSDDALLKRATQLLREGAHGAAASILRPLTVRHDQNARLLHLAGSAELLAGSHAQAAELLQKSLAINPDQADTLSHLGVAFWNLKDFNRAAKAYRAAITLKPDYAEALNNLCLLLLEGFHQPEEALAVSDRVLSMAPSYTDAYINRGNALQALGRYEEALESYDQALALQPNLPSAHNNRGNALRKLGCLLDAVSAYQQAIRLKPAYPEAFCNMGCTLVDLGLFDDARLLYQRSIALDASFADAHYNLGILEASRNNHALALACYDRAISLKPTYAEAYWNKSLLLLLLGDYEQGFALYEWGWKCGFRGGDRGFKAPRWLGQLPLTGKRLLIHHEQGLGDCVHYVRYIQLAVNAGAEVILETLAPLLPLLKTLAPACKLVVRGTPLPPFDYYTPLMSLPLAFGTTLSNMPPAAPYLFADSTRMAAWSEKLGPQTKPRVGLVWSGSTLHKNDQNRSVALKMLLPLLALPLDFHSLQQEFRDDDALCLPALPMVHTHDNAIHDFADTAALASLMDVIISVDTSVAHVAGAIGKPVWILLPAAPDWRWQLNREDSPWYPSARLFRQSKPGDWTNVIMQVRAALTEMLLKIQ